MGIERQAITGISGSVDLHRKIEALRGVLKALEADRAPTKNLLFRKRLPAVNDVGVLRLVDNKLLPLVRTALGLALQLDEQLTIIVPTVASIELSDRIVFGDPPIPDSETDEEQLLREAASMSPGSDSLTNVGLASLLRIIDSLISEHPENTVSLIDHPALAETRTKQALQTLHDTIWNLDPSLKLYQGLHQFGVLPASMYPQVNDSNWLRILARDEEANNVLASLDKTVICKPVLSGLREISQGLLLRVVTEVPLSVVKPTAANPRRKVLRYGESQKDLVNALENFWIAPKLKADDLQLLLEWFSWGQANARKGRGWFSYTSLDEIDSQSRRLISAVPGLADSGSKDFMDALLEEALGSTRRRHGNPSASSASETRSRRRPGPRSR